MIPKICVLSVFLSFIVCLCINFILSLPSLMTKCPHDRSQLHFKKDISTSSSKESKPIMAPQLGFIFVLSGIQTGEQQQEIWKFPASDIMDSKSMEFTKKNIAPNFLEDRITIIYQQNTKYIFKGLSMKKKIVIPFCMISLFAIPHSLNIWMKRDIIN